MTVTYTRGLQYWAEKHNLPESLDFSPLAGGIVELREVVRELITFTNWDILHGLGAVHPGATNQWPQTSLFSQVLLPLGNKPSGLDAGFTEATILTAPPVAADVDTARCTTLPFGTEGKTSICWSLLPV